MVVFAFGGNREAVRGLQGCDQNIVFVQQDIIAGVRDVGGDGHANFVGFVQAQRVAGDVVVQDVVFEG